MPPKLKKTGNNATKYTGSYFTTEKLSSRRRFAVGTCALYFYQHLLTILLLIWKTDVSLKQNMHALPMYWFIFTTLEKTLLALKHSRDLSRHSNALRHRRDTLQWRHNERDGVSNYQPDDRSLNRLFGRRSKNTSKLRVTGPCEGNSLVIGEFPAQRANNAENVSI